MKFPIHLELWLFYLLASVIFHRSLLPSTVKILILKDTGNNEIRILITFPTLHIQQSQNNNNIVTSIITEKFKFFACILVFLYVLNN